MIGGEVNEIGTNAAFGDGEWLVLEADESDGTFLQLRPDVALVTSVEPDHLGHYHGRFSELVGAFEQFVDGARGAVMCSADDRIAARIAATRPHVRTYGEAAAGTLVTLISSVDTLEVAVTQGSAA